MGLNYHVSSHHPGSCQAPIPLSGPLARRSLITLGAVVVSAMAAGQPRRALAAPTVSIAPPRLERGAHCKATVSVQITLSNLALGAPYAVSGELWEADEPHGEPDFCGDLEPQTFLMGSTASQRLVLTRHALAADLGLVKGLGPANDETSNPERIELFARVWLRNLERGHQYGPWESPRRDAVSAEAADWARAPAFPGSELMVPRGNQAVPTCD